MQGHVVKRMGLIFAAGVVVIAAIAVMILMKRDHHLMDVPPVTVQYHNPYRDLLEDSAIAPQAPEIALQQSLAGTLRISSQSLKEGVRIPRVHSCNGKNQSPPFSWTGAPRGTKSYVVLFERVDAEQGNQIQWSVYNLPANVQSLPDAMPKVALLDNGIGQGIHDQAGNVGYIGPCIARGQASYQLRVYALDTALSLPGGVGRDALFQAMNGHVIDIAAMNLIYYYRL